GGAGDVEGAAQIARDLERLARQATAGRTFESIAAAVWPEHHVPEEARLKGLAESALEAHAGAVVVPLHLGKRLDGMMALSIAQRRAAPEGSHWVDEAPLDALLLTWMQREANRALPWQSGEDGNVGVVIAAHGSDWHWNETMRQAVAPLAARYRLAFAYSMADPIIVERAVRRLEAQGAQAIVVVRVFGLEDSFRSAFRRMAGLDVEDALAVDGSASHEHGQGHVPTMAAPDGHGHHGHGAAAGSGRIRSPAVLLTAGGLDDDPLFARALLARADALSRDPARETLILTAHGTFSDERNARWLEVLARIADRMRAEGADRFRDIRVATWREDWPDKREAWVPRVRAWVEAASEDGTAIVIPARTNGTGPEARLLEGLDFRLGSGFAPHPLFAEWVESQVRSALEQARRPPVPAMARIDRITP
ncbi:MAG: hypothetical protein KDH20_18930, partial [Rhodocyclaceae bacterium]|nr:hypothetical protein [Rhodocyclaceae bacterium]